MLERRGLIRGLLTIPLVGGGVTLIGKASRRVPLADVAAAPFADDPIERARYAWAAFSTAMRDATVPSDGWFVQGGEQVRAVGYLPVRKPWLTARSVDLLPVYTSGLAERHGEIFSI